MLKVRGLFLPLNFGLADVLGNLAFGWASVPYSIWFGIPWAMTGRYFIDAVIYSAIVAGCFAGFWPGA